MAQGRHDASTSGRRGGRGDEACRTGTAALCPAVLRLSVGRFAGRCSRPSVAQGADTGAPPGRVRWVWVPAGRPGTPRPAVSLCGRVAGLRRRMDVARPVWPESPAVWARGFSGLGRRVRSAGLTGTGDIRAVDTAAARRHGPPGAMPAGFVRQPAAPPTPGAACNRQPTTGNREAPVTTRGADRPAPGRAGRRLHPDSRAPRRGVVRSRLRCEGRSVVKGAPF